MKLLKQKLIEQTYLSEKQIDLFFEILIEGMKKLKIYSLKDLSFHYFVFKNNNIYIEIYKEIIGSYYHALILHKLVEIVDYAFNRENNKAIAKEAEEFVVF